MSDSRHEPREITALLRAHASGDDAFDRLIPLVYKDLRRIARRHMRQEPAGHTLDATAVVHEVYLQLAEQTRACWPDRAHFFAFASRAMRHVLIDHARRRRTQKRGGGPVFVPLAEFDAATAPPLDELLALDEALSRLAAHDVRLVRVVECRIFGGMTAEETAAALGISRRTLQRDWTRAKAYLYRMLGPHEPPFASNARDEAGRGPV